MNAIVRRAVAEDAPSLATVHIETWQAAYRGQLPAAYLDNLSHELAHRTEMWRERIATSKPDSHEIWVAEIDHRVEGFVALGPARDEGGKRTGEVYAIYVHPRNWDQGIGQQLFSRASDRLAARGYATAVLWVLESNARARRFYEIAGWTADGRAKTDRHPDGMEFRDVSYSMRLNRNNEE
ncbi:MAG TPA: GNAT family N-acetyltransferase [Verrucomicrobiae bacterium]|nr:GNAT family N-acetyltransferase [Verrucomicrobiae bacterium]